MRRNFLFAMEIFYIKLNTSWDPGDCTDDEHTKQPQTITFRLMTNKKVWYEDCKIFSASTPTDVAQHSWESIEQTTKKLAELYQ